MRTIALRHLAEINPAAPEFDALPDDSDVMFLPLEAVWADNRADQTRRIPKGSSGGYTRFDAGDIVSPKVTPTFQAARTMITKHTGAGTTELHVLRARPGVDPRWIAYALRSNHYLREGVTAFQGVAGLQRVPADFVSSFRVTDVDGDEQRQIADFLDDRVARIDQIIAARQQQIDLLSAACKSLADELLTDADWASSARFGYFIQSIEQGWSPQCDSVPAAPDEWGVLKVSAVRDGRFRPDENKLLPQDLEPQTEYEVQPGDLLITRANTPALVGAFAAVPADVRSRLILCDKIMRVSVAGELLPEFAALVGQARRVRDLLSGSGTGTSQSMVNVRGDDIRDLPMPRLAVWEQQRRVKAWDEQRATLTNSEDALSSQIALLQEFKQSLITAAVTGELDVTTASTKIPE